MGANQSGAGQGGDASRDRSVLKALWTDRWTDVDALLQSPLFAATDGPQPPGGQPTQTGATADADADSASSKAASSSDSSSSCSSSAAGPGGLMNAHGRYWRERVHPVADSAYLSTLPINRRCLRQGGFSILHQAVCVNSPQLILSLLAAGADPNQPSTAPLCGRSEHLLATGGYMYQAAVEPLRPVTPDPARPRSAGGGRSLRPPSQWILRYADRLCGNLNSDVKYRELGLTPLMLAILFAEDQVVCEICSLLLWSGADINASTRPSAWTASVFAAQRGLAPLWSLMHAYGFDAEQHQTAMDVAQTFGGERCVAVLRDEEARLDRLCHEIDAVLGDGFQMAQDCVNICQQYAGLRANVRPSATQSTNHQRPSAIGGNGVVCL